MFAHALRFLALAVAASVFLLVNADSSRAQEEAKAADMFDQYVGFLGECDRGARLDNLAITLQNTPKSKGFILIYTGKYDLPARVSAYRDATFDYLVNSRGIAPAQITVVDAGYRQELTTELWIVPKGADAPKPADVINPKKELDEAFKFDDQSIYVESDTDYIVEEFEPIEEVASETSMEAENAQTVAEEQADTAGGAVEQAEDIQDVPATYQGEGGDTDSDVWWTSKAYARALQVEAKARGHIIFYADRKEAHFSKVQTVVEQAMRQLTEKYGIEAKRLTAVFGGYRESPKAELWLVPVNVSLPVPTPEPEKADEEKKKQAKELPPAP